MVKRIITLLMALLSAALFTSCEENEDRGIEYYVKYKVTSNNAIHPAQLVLTTPPLREDESNQLRMFIDGDFEGEYGPFYSGDEVYMVVYSSAGLDPEEYVNSVYVRVGKDGVYNLVETTDGAIHFILK